MMLMNEYDLDAMDPFGCSLPGSDVFEYLEEVGHGRYSEIYKARRRDDGSIVALKYLPAGGKEVVPVQREVEALQRLSGCSRIPQYHGMYSNEFGVSLAIDFYPRYDISNYLMTRKTSTSTTATTMDHAPQNDIRRMVLHMLEAVQQCHTHGIIHRDIAPYNFLVDEQGNISLADFGISICTHNSMDRTPGMGTLWYMAPEILFGSTAYTTASDVWSLGCVITELMMGRPLWNGTSQLDQICKIIDDLGTPREEEWPGLSELPDWGKVCFPPKAPTKNWLDTKTNGFLVPLVERMLVYAPCRRCSITECIDMITNM